MGPFLSPYDGTPAGASPGEASPPGEAPAQARRRPSAPEGERVPQRRKSTSEGWMILAAEPSAAW